MKRYSKTFRRYLVPYVLLLLLPILATSFFAHYLIFDEIAQAQQNESDFAMKRVINAMDSEITKVMQVVYQAAQLSEFRSFALEKPTNFSSIKAYLLNYTTVVPVISEIVYYNVQHPRLYTSLGTISLDYAKEWEESFWGRRVYSDSFLKTVRNPMWYADEKGAVLILLYPLEKRNGEYRSFLALKLNTTLIETFLTDHSNQNGLSAVLYNQQGERLFETTNYTESTNKNHTSYDDQLSFKEAPLRIRFILPQSAALTKVKSIQNSYYAILVAVILIGGTIITLAMQKTYSPVKRLTGAAQEYVDESIKESDAITLIEGSLSNLVQQNTYMRSLVVQANRERFLRAAVFSPYTEKEMLDELAQEAEIRGWRQDFYTFAMFSRLGDFTNKQAEHLIQTVMDDAHNVLGIYVFSEQAPDHVTMMILHHEDNIDDLLQKIYTVISSISSDGIRMAASTPSREYDNIARCYFEVHHQLNGMQNTGLKETNHNEIEYPNVELNTLKALVESNELKQVKNVVVELLAIASIVRSEIVSLRICFEIISILNSNHRFRLSIKADDDTPALPQLTALIREHVEGLKDTVSPQEEQLRQIMDFVKEHYADPDFSITNLAKYFHMSVSSISQKFKQAESCGLLKYITELKIMKAKDLLVSTQLNVLEISSLLGYAQSSGFIRKFKEIVGCTPGEYRLSHKR